MFIVARDFKKDGHTVERMEYDVTDENGDLKTIEFAKSWAETINANLKEGHDRLKITRKGIGIETSYTIIAV